ncbi:beta-lactamase family protein [Algoriphagus sp. H41]|uniref:Beta-lactamase family protein n=1 Tax=Algoriphagus oliviformis TaxID=2811231 RepID=A0ABS3C7S6_9BACT|nr:serine hydrolase domain-containing protein [Algoriphagus oliviformis]MBN7813170.1 beta-lactamase family protein [Algoriphagus oliviformis]
MKASLLLLFLNLALSSTTFPQENPITAGIAKLMEEKQVPGISYTYLEQGQVKDSFALGVTNQDGSAVDQHTVFSAASLSKPVFAYLVMQLVDEGLIELDSSLSSYYTYPDIQDEPEYRLVTARMVLSHSSGLPNWRNGKLKFKYRPGERFSYSGEGYVWLQRVVEHLKGKPLEDLAQQYVFQPLGMTRSSYVFLPAFEENHSLSFKKDGKQQPKNKIQSANAAASLQTTSRDFGIFLEALLSAKHISPELHRLMFAPQVPVDPKQGQDQELFWGLGVGIQVTSAGKQIFQWGDNYTFRGYFTADVENRNAVVYLSNSENGLKPVRELVDLVLADPQPACDWMDYD